MAALAQQQSVTATVKRTHIKLKLGRVDELAEVEAADLGEESENESKKGIKDYARSV